MRCHLQLKLIFRNLTHPNTGLWPAGCFRQSEKNRNFEKKPAAFSNNLRPFGIRNMQIQDSKWHFALSNNFRKQFSRNLEDSEFLWSQNRDKCRLRLTHKVVDWVNDAGVQDHKIMTSKDESKEIIVTKYKWHIHNTVFTTKMHTWTKTKHRLFTSPLHTLPEHRLRQVMNEAIYQDRLPYSWTSRSSARALVKLCTQPLKSAYRLMRPNKWSRKVKGQGHTHLDQAATLTPVARVLVQQRHPRKCLLTLLAAVLLHIRVRLQVRAQVRAISERSPTVPATERFLTRVSSYVTWNMNSIFRKYRTTNRSRQCVLAFRPSFEVPKSFYVTWKMMFSWKSRAELSPCTTVPPLVRG